MYKETKPSFSKDEFFLDSLQCTHNGLVAIIEGRQDSMSPVTTTYGLIDPTFENAKFIMHDLRAIWANTYPDLFVESIKTQQ